jgi:hypothetical protein
MDSKFNTLEIPTPEQVKEIAAELEKLRSEGKKAVIPSEGLGDTIAKITCGSCEKRKKLLNRIVPY